MAIRAERAESSLQVERRRQSRASEAWASSCSGEGSLRYFTQPKLVTPWTFAGEYSEFENVLTWFYTVERYLDQCRAFPEDWTGYAITYTTKRVQTWFHTVFPQGIPPPWEEVKQEMTTRFLPPDHKLRLRMKFNSLSQRHSLRQYVEDFRRMEAALITAQIKISEEDKVLQFLKGMNSKTEKLALIQKDPKSLKEAFEGVTDLESAKMLTWGLSGSERKTQEDPWGSEKGKTSSKSQLDRESHKCQQEQTQQAWKNGLCLGCGAADHKLKNCPKTLQEWKHAFLKMARQTTKKAKMGKAQGRDSSNRYPK